MLMRLFALAGQQAAAIRQYDECVRILNAELNIPPEDETTELYEEIRTRRFPARVSVQEGEGEKPTRGSGEEVIASLPHHTFTRSSTQQIKKQNLPTQPTSFIGREDELASIRQLLVAEEHCRLLTLIGPGGIGKTRLAIEAASATLDVFPDGVYFVPLVSVEDEENIFTMMAEAMRFGLQGGDTPKAQICSFLGTHKVLFILDNFEHLLGGAVDVGELLHAASNVSVLVTSREALGLQEEWLYSVLGMGLPTQADTLSAVETNASIRLFVERARAVPRPPLR